MTIHHRDIATKESEGVASWCCVLLVLLVLQPYCCRCSCRCRCRGWWCCCCCGCLTPSTFRGKKNNCNCRCTMRQFRVATCNAVDPDKQTLRASCSCSEPDLDPGSERMRNTWPGHHCKVAKRAAALGGNPPVRPRSFPFFCRFVAGASAAKRLLQFSSRAPWQRVPGSFSFSLSRRRRRRRRRRWRR